MPKVTQEYFNKKREEIIEAAISVFKEKPLYEINMMDIIKQAGLSKGGIYIYFSDINEIIIEIINRESSKYDYKSDIDNIINKSNSKEDIICGLLTVLGNHIDNDCEVLGKLQFELSILQANDKVRAEKMLSRLTEYENGKYLIDSLLNVISEGLRKEEFKCDTSEEYICDYIRVCIEGLTKVVIFERCYGMNSGRSVKPKEIINALSNNILLMLKGIC